MLRSVLALEIVVMAMKELANLTYERTRTWLTKMELKSLNGIV